MNREERVLKYINSSDDFLVDGKRYCENDFYNDVEDLAKENKILRENAEHNDKVVDKVNWENLKLKKQLEEANEKILLLQVSEPMLEYKKVLEENQQKKFIEYLESYLKLFDNKDIYEEGSYDTIEEILSKYKEMVSNNVESER